MQCAQVNLASVQYPAVRFLGNAAIETGGGERERSELPWQTMNQMVGCVAKGLNKEDISSTRLWRPCQKGKSDFFVPSRYRLHLSCECNHLYVACTCKVLCLSSGAERNLVLFISNSY